MPNQKQRIHKPNLSQVPKVEQHQVMDSSGLPQGIQIDLAQTVKKPPSGNLALKNQQNTGKAFDSQGAELTKEQIAKR